MKDSDSRDEEIQDLKKIIGDQSLVIDAFKKKASREVKIMVINDLKDQIPLREISRDVS